MSIPQASLPHSGVSLCSSLKPGFISKEHHLASFIPKHKDWSKEADATELEECHCAPDCARGCTVGTGDLLASGACFSVLSQSCEKWQGMELVRWAGVTSNRANVPMLFLEAGRVPLLFSAAAWKMGHSKDRVRGMKFVLNTRQTAKSVFRRAAFTMVFLLIYLKFSVH